MVTTGGVNRHMVLYINKQMEYEAIVFLAMSHQEYYITQMTEVNLPASISKHVIWLRLMGLAETRDMML